MAMILPTVAPTAQPMQQFAAPAGKNMAAEQTMQAGEAMTKTGNAVHNVFADIQSNIDTATTKEIDNKLSDVIHNTLYDPEKGYLKTAGKSAIESRSAAIDQITKASEELSQGLTNEVQQYMFKQTATARMRQAMGQIDTHAMKQTQVYNMGETEARLKGFMRDAEANVNDREAFNTAKTSMLREADDYIKLSGMGADQGKQYKLTATTTMHGNVISQLLNGDEAKLAQEYFAKYKDEINPDKYDEFSKVIGDKVAFVDGNQIGGSVYAQFAPKNINESIHTAEGKMLAAIEKSGADEQTKKYAKKAIKDQIDQYNEFKRGAIENAGNDLYGYMNSKGATYGNSINMVNQWEKAGKIDHKDAEALREAADRKFRISEGRAEAKQAQNLKYLGNLLKFQNDYAAGLLGKLEPAQLAKMMNNFGPFTDNAMQFVNTANSTADDVKLSMDGMKQELRVMKQNPAFKDLKTIPNPDSNGEEDKAAMALLNQRVIARIAASGKAGPGKQMTVQQALAEELKPVVTGKGFLWDDVTPRYKLGTTAADDPKKWTKEAKTAFINDQFYRKNGRYPTPYEATVFMHQLDK